MLLHNESAPEDDDLEDAEGEAEAAADGQNGKQLVAAGDEPK